MVGSLETNGAVWQPWPELPADAEPSDFGEEIAAEAEDSRLAWGIE